MRTRHLLCLAFFGLLPALSAQVRIAAGPVVSRDCAVDQPPAMSRFMGTDPHLSVWVRLDGVSPGDSISLVYTDPSGGTHPDDSPVTSRRGGLGAFCFAKRTRVLLPFGSGAWSVTGYLNNQPTPLFGPVQFRLEGQAVEPRLTEGPVLSSISASPCPQSAPQPTANFAASGPVTLWLRMDGLDASDRVEVTYTGPNGTTQQRTGSAFSGGVVCVGYNVRSLATAGGNGKWTLTAKLQAQTTPLSSPVSFTLDSASGAAQSTAAAVPAPAAASGSPAGHMRLTAGPVLALLSTPGCPTTPPEATNRFLSNDQYVGVWFQADGRVEGDTLRAVFTAPNGKDLPRRAFLLGARGPGTQHCFRNAPAALAAEGGFGAWSVTAYINDETTPLFSHVPFRIENVGGVAPGGQTESPLPAPATPVADRPAAAGGRLTAPLVISKLACQGSAPPASTRFLSTDPYITVWMPLESFAAGDSFQLKLTDPNGREHPVGGQGRFNQAGRGPICSDLKSTLLGANVFGAWSLAGYWNGQTTSLFPPIAFTFENTGTGAQSLDAEMRLIETTLSSVAPVTYKNLNDGSTYFWKASNVRANAAGCRIDFRITQTKDGRQTSDNDHFVDLRALSQIKANDTAQTQPVFYVVHLIPKSGAQMTNLDIAVPGRTTAVALLTALTHSAKLCGSNLDDGAAPPPANAAASPAPAPANAAAATGPRSVGTPVVNALARDAACPSTPPAPVTRFAFSDPIISVWFLVQGLHSGDTVLFKLTDPNGNDHGTSSSYSPATDFSGPLCWHQAPNEFARFGYGAWSASAYLKGQTTPLFPPVQFTISAPDPNLAATLNYIQDTLNSIGRIEWTLRNPDHPGTPSAATTSFEVSGAAADIGACSFSFNRSSVVNQSRSDFAFRFPFRSVSEANVAEESAYGPGDSRNPSREGSWNVLPPHWVLKLSFSGNPPATARQGDRENVLNATSILFRDEETANNVAKAIVSATDMCNK